MSDKNIDVGEIYQNALKDPSLFSTIDIDKMLDSIENEKNDYLENKTMDSVTQEICEKISDLPISDESKENICKKLIGYRYVDEIHELHKGKITSWIRIKKSAAQELLERQIKGSENTYTIQPKLSGTGILVNIKFADRGTNVVISNPPNHRFTQYRFDDCLTFQKMTEEEQLILMAYEYLDKESS
jgi:hypothetical protein